MEFMLRHTTRRADMLIHLLNKYSVDAFTRFLFDRSIMMSIHCKQGSSAMILRLLTLGAVICTVSKGK